MKKVAILIPTSRSFGRGLIKGITQYSRNCGNWTLYMPLSDYTRGGHGAKIKRLIANWKPDGIIARLPFLDIDSVDLFDVPAVITHIYAPDEKYSNIIPDCDKYAQMAADYLINKGFRNFAFCGFNMFWCKLRAECFSKYLNYYGYECNIYHSPWKNIQVPWEKEHASIVKWLNTIPKPFAVLATNDDRGRHVLEACKSTNLRVPEDIAVLGADNDELVCNATNPPLSSIAYNTERAGYQAAQQLNRMMENKLSDNLFITINPTKVVTRRSSDIIAIKDEAVSDALRYISKNYRKPIQIQDVVNATTVSRRVLESRFKKNLGKTIHDEIVRIRINHTLEMLVDTNFTISQISYLLGFSHPKRLNEIFSKVMKMTPSEYRRKYSMQDVSRNVI